MDPMMLRVLVGVGIALVLVWQGWTNQQRPQRRLAMWFAAGAFLTLSVVNWLGSTNGLVGVIGPVLLLIALICFAASVLFFFRSWRKGEFQRQGQEFRDAMRSYREQRENQDQNG